MALSDHPARSGLYGASGTSRPTSATRSRTNRAAQDEDVPSHAPLPTPATSPLVTNVRRSSMRPLRVIVYLLSSMAELCPARPAVTRMRATRGYHVSQNQCCEHAPPGSHLGLPHAQRATALSLLKTRSRRVWRSPFQMDGLASPACESSVRGAIHGEHVWRSDQKGPECVAP